MSEEQTETNIWENTASDEETKALEALAAARETEEVLTEETEEEAPQTEEETEETEEKEGDTSEDATEESPDGADDEIVETAPELDDATQHEALVTYLKTYDLDANAFPYAPLEVTDETTMGDLPKETQEIINMKTYRPMEYFTKYELPLIRAEFFRIQHWQDGQKTSADNAAKERTEFFDQNQEAKTQFDALVTKGRSPEDAFGIIRDLVGENRPKGKAKATPKPTTSTPVKGSTTKPKREKKPDYMQDDQWEDIEEKVLRALDNEG